MQIFFILQCDIATLNPTVSILFIKMVWEKTRSHLQRDAVTCTVCFLQTSHLRGTSYNNIFSKKNQTMREEQTRREAPSPVAVAGINTAQEAQLLGIAIGRHGDFVSLLDLFLTSELSDQHSLGCHENY